MKLLKRDSFTRLGRAAEVEDLEGKSPAELYSPKNSTLENIVLSRSRLFLSKVIWVRN